MTGAASLDAGGHLAAGFADDVRRAMTRQPRELPPRYFYDALGLALFDAIGRLPWYPIGRAETALLARHGEEVLAGARPLSRIVELGSGTGGKLATLAAAFPRAGVLPDLHVVDASPAAVAGARRALADVPGVRIATHEAVYESGLDQALAGRGAGRTLVLSLGSNIGNFHPEESARFLRAVREALAPGDALLLGVDLVKPERDLILAYDDPLGVTAAFNRNLLCRVNRELGGDFRLEGFAHEARWNRDSSRIEMHLVSTERQRVRVPAAGVDLAFAPGESIWTESSYKLEPPEILARLEAAGFSPAGQWMDTSAAFALTLAHAG